MLLDNLNLKESMLIIPINPNTVDKIRKLKQIEYAKSLKEQIEFKLNETNKQKENKFSTEQIALIKLAEELLLLIIKNFT
jgi:hypothetical protein